MQLIKSSILVADWIFSYPDPERLRPTDNPLTKRSCDAPAADVTRRADRPNIVIYYRWRQTGWDKTQLQLTLINLKNTTIALMRIYLSAYSVFYLYLFNRLLYLIKYCIEIKFKLIRVLSLYELERRHLKKNVLCMYLSKSLMYFKVSLKRHVQETRTTLWSK